MSSTIDEKITKLEDELRETPKNKSTEKHTGVLKSKIAKLRRKKLDLIASSKSGPSYGFDVKKAGDGSAVLIGFPSTGKSTVLTKITSKASKIGHYDFTTTKAIPGILEHRGTQIQLIDLPGIIEEASKGKGRGREILAVARSSDLIVILLERNNPLNIYEKIIDELSKVAIRPGKIRPDIKIVKKDRGGIALSTLFRLTHMSEKTFIDILREYKVMNAAVTVRGDPTMDDLIDVLEGNRVYPKLLVVVNKIDLLSSRKLASLKRKLPNAVFISALEEENLELLKDRIIDELELIQVYLKKQRAKTDYEEPLIVKRDSSIKDVCNKIHRKFKRQFRYAVVSGKSTKHPFQRVGLDHIVQDGDVITIIIKQF
ncbi:MAG: GTP-binding protein [Candidatus Heimdallarchaeota archaeon]|nr:GTP-binding protein [Candidatus Heimdallarchaeota archaeon]